MATRDHIRAVQSARRMEGQLKQLMARLGSHAQPNVGLFGAYVAARRQLKGNVGSPAQRAILTELQMTVNQVMQAQTTTALELALEEAERTLAAYGLAAPIPRLTPTTPAVSAVSAIVSQQITAIESGMFKEVEILGDAGRVGLLAPGLATREGARWLGKLVNERWGMSVNGAVAGSGQMWLKQAVAGIDERTTDCCLRVHGQTQPMDVDFILTGTPRYADRLPAPPFHQYCRTSQALILREHAEDDLTADMKKAARTESALRDRPDYRPPHPANALTRVRS